MSGDPEIQALSSRGGTRLTSKEKYVFPLWCERLRGPTEQEYEQLRFIFQADTPQGFRPLLADGFGGCNATIYYAGSRRLDKMSTPTRKKANPSAPSWFTPTHEERTDQLSPLLMFVLTLSPRWGSGLGQRPPVSSRRSRSRAPPRWSRKRQCSAP